MTKFKVGDRVANKNREEISYNWHGTIVAWYNGNDEVCWVEWEERKEVDSKGKPKYQVAKITARVENLRLRSE